jgi:pyruvate,orthophosphate dikinase
MLRNAGRFVYSLDDPPPGTHEDLRTLLGGKGANLVVMARDLGLPVPPAFTISTAACRAFLADAWPASLDEELRSQMVRLGEKVGRRFGDPEDPLLVSVRSGAPVSMPGMMDTVLNLGLTDATAEGLARTVGGDFAADCVRRFKEGYAAVVEPRGAPDDPWLQLRAAIEAVFRSWNSDRAQAYRRREGIADDLGTAVTVQAMVFGNRGADSGTGVVFTRNPATGERELYGDVLFDAQGEDVVAGTHATQAISELEARMPDVAAKLRRIADTLERHHADLCDIEFTIEDGRLWMLQVRVGKRSPRAALRMAIEMAEDEDFPLSREDAVRRVAPLLADPPREFVRATGAAPPIAVGLPASPGVATGAIVTTSEAAEAAGSSGKAVILVRSETSPEDVRGMAVSAGVLTARGGLASHAAVVARGWGVPAVVGASGIDVRDDAIGVDGRVLAAGEVITIDGGTGEVFAGELEGEWQTVAEGQTLRAWADELGIAIQASAATETPAPIPADGPFVGGETAESAVTAAADDVARVLLIKGTCTLEQLSESLDAGAAGVGALVEELSGSGLAETIGSDVRLTAQGKLAAADAFANQRSEADIDDERAPRLLDEFHALDVRMKDIVTGWQVRDVGGKQVLNDHTDTEYDARLLKEMSRLHDDAVGWLRSLACAPIPQLGVYGNRLGRALEAARNGDQRYVASPRVDSFHSVWFELHEHLIRLTGRKRSDEAAAGRA